MSTLKLNQYAEYHDRCHQMYPLKMTPRHTFCYNTMRQKHTKQKKKRTTDVSYLYQVTAYRFSNSSMMYSFEPTSHTHLNRPNPSYGDNYVERSNILNEQQSKEFKCFWRWIFAMNLTKTGKLEQFVYFIRWFVCPAEFEQRAPDVKTCWCFIRYNWSTRTLKQATSNRCGQPLS